MCPASAPKGQFEIALEFFFALRTGHMQHHASDEFLKRGIAQFERLYAESAETTRIMAISLHPYVSGVAHRIGHLEELYRHITSKPGVKMWTGEQIIDWYKEVQPALAGDG